jgi:hypothetical protein
VDQFNAGKTSKLAAVTVEPVHPRVEREEVPAVLRSIPRGDGLPAHTGFVERAFLSLLRSILEARHLPSE